VALKIDKHSVLLGLTNVLQSIGMTIWDLHQSLTCNV